MTTHSQDNENKEIAHENPADLVRISWGSVFAGALVGLAVLASLTLFGMGIGFGFVEPTLDGDALQGIGIGSAFWVGVSMIASLFIGGFVAARMSGQPNTVTAMMHGVTVWALVTVAVIWLAGSAIGGIVGGTVNTVTAGAQASGSAIASAASYAERQISQVNLEEMVPNDLSQELRSRLEEEGITPQNFRSEFRTAIENSALGQDDLDQLRENARETAREIARNPRNFEEITKDFIDNLTGEGNDVVVSDSERTQIVDRLVNRTGITRDEARAYIDRAQDRVREAREELAESLEAAKERAEDVAEDVADSIAGAAFGSFFGLLLALFGAAGGAAVGSPNHLHVPENSMALRDRGPRGALSPFTNIKNTRIKSWICSA